jgi:hypothetical protein
LNVELFRIPKIPKIPKTPKVPKIRKPSNGRIKTLLEHGANISTIAANLADLGINIYSAVG